MAKRRSTSKVTVKVARKSKRSSRRKAPGRMSGLDQKAQEYARLLADPCNSPLVHPVYPGGDAGYLFRAESFATIGTSAGTTSGVVHWTPGYINNSDTQLLTMSAATATTSVGLAIADGATIVTPGRDFLRSNAKGVRCVAACLKVTFPGAESARSGRIHYGLTTASMLDLAQSVTADDVAQTLQHYSRTPAETVEIFWKPNIGDTELNDPLEAAGALIRDRKSSITVSWAGLPAAVGLTFHFTAVYEWTPATGRGVAHNALGKNQSVNTLDQVLDALIRSGFTFVRHAGNAAGSVLGTALTRGITNTFGLMPSQPSSRNLLSYR